MAPAAMVLPMVAKWWYFDRKRFASSTLYQLPMDDLVVMVSESGKFANSRGAHHLQKWRLQPVRCS